MKLLASQRKGLSLAEVLIAIFVLGIGLLGIMSLFPLGAVKMAQAIKDDRTANLSSNAASMLRWIWREEVSPMPPVNRPRAMFPFDPAVPLNPITWNNVDYFDPLFNAMENPNYPWYRDLATSQPVPYPSPVYVIPNVGQGTPTAVVRRFDRNLSHPVFVDPIGWNNPYFQGTAKQFWLGGDITTIPRRSIQRLEFDRNGANNYKYVTDLDAMYGGGTKLALRHRHLVMMDDLSFSLTGTPQHADGVNNTSTVGVAGMRYQVQRDGRYSCGFLFQREQNNIQNEVDVSIVVFSGRPTDADSQESVYTTTFIKGSNEAYLNYTGFPRPKLRKGNWILDGTMYRIVNGVPVAENNPANRHGVFYRIVNVTEDPLSPNVLTLELSEPAEGTTVDPQTGVVFGRGVVMDGVVEVFRGKRLTNNSRPVP